MAHFVVKTPVVTINGVDLSDHIKSATITYQAEEKQDTSFGAASVTRLPGLLNWSIAVEAHNDFAASEIDATLFPLVGAASFTVTVKPTNASPGATNPNYSGSCLLTSYPINLAIGEISTTSITMPGTGTLSRLT
jgi:hypothetical protein